MKFPASPLSSVSHTWSAITDFLPRAGRRFCGLAVLSIGSGLGEAASLVLVVAMATRVVASDGVPVSAVPSVLGEEPSKWFAVSLALVVISICFGVAGAYSASRISESVLVEARQKIIESFMQSSYIHQAQQREGAIQNDVSVLAVHTSNLCAYLATALSASLTLMALIGAALIVSPTATAIILVSGVGLYSLLRPLSRRTQRFSAEYLRSNNEFAADLAAVASLTGEFRSFGVEDQVTEQLISRNTRIGLGHRQSRFAALLATASYRNVALLVVVIVLGAISSTGSSAAKEVGVVVILTIRSLGYANTYQAAAQSLYEYLPNAEELRRRLASAVAHRDRDGSEMISAVGEIEFRDVNFEFGNANSLLSLVNLRVSLGESVGIVGVSGSGKTTLLELILRLHAPTCGEILINGRQLNSIRRDSLGRHIAFVPQVPVMVEGTVLDNIRFMRQWLREEQLIEAAIRAQLDELSLRNGWNTRVGPRGVGLSGGQRQRIAIARALAARPDLIVLDEPTSALDHETESAVVKVLTRLKDECAVILVTHRTEALECCDRVYRMEHGSLVEVAHR